MARILVIDDEATIRSAIHKTLQMAGYEVDEASDGEAGVEHYRNKPADLVITDIRMPKKDGLEVIEELLSDYPDTKIIAITAYAEESIRKAEELGAARTFLKPISMKGMLETVKEVLGEN